jgi:hypothetical protein
VTISDDGIKGLVKLRSLNLTHNCFITDDGIKGLTNLTSLILKYNYRITRDGLKPLISLEFVDSSNSLVVNSNRFGGWF